MNQQGYPHPTQMGPPPAGTQQYPAGMLWNPQTQQWVPTKKKRKIGKVLLWIVMTVLALIGILGLIGAVSGGSSTPPAPTTQSAPAPERGTVPNTPAPTTTTTDTSLDITYEVTGDGPMMITYSAFGTGAGYTSASESYVRAPWSKTVHPDLYTTGSLTVSRSGGTGTVTARVLSHGQVVAENTSTGPYASVSVSGSNY